MKKSNPQTWVAPTWHPDFGDPAIELEQLRVVGVAILENIAETEVRLECVEEGYMSVAVSKRGVAIGEVNVIDADSDDRKYGVFVETAGQDEEAYFSSADLVAEHIARFVS